MERAPPDPENRTVGSRPPQQHPAPNSVGNRPTGEAGQAMGMIRSAYPKVCGVKEGELGFCFLKSGPL